MDFGRNLFADPWFGWMLSGVATTLFVATTTGLSALVLGTLLSAARTARSRAARFATAAFIGFFRNLPPVPLVLLLVLGLPTLWREAFGVRFPPGREFLLLLLALSLNAAAYVAEVLRGGLEAVPKGQWDAGRALGLSPLSIRARVIYPQALRICLPALGNRLIHNTKNSTVALVVPLPVTQLEVLGQAARTAGRTFAWAEPLIFAAAVHLALAFLLGALFARLSRRAMARVEVAA